MIIDWDVGVCDVANFFHVESNQQTISIGQANFESAQNDQKSVNSRLSESDLARVRIVGPDQKKSRL